MAIESEKPRSLLRGFWQFISEIIVFCKCFAILIHTCFYQCVRHYVIFKGMVEFFGIADITVDEADLAVQ